MTTTAFSHVRRGVPVEGVRRRPGRGPQARRRDGRAAGLGHRHPALPRATGLRVHRRPAAVGPRAGRRGGDRPGWTGGRPPAEPVRAVVPPREGGRPARPCARRGDHRRRRRVAGARPARRRPGRPRRAVPRGPAAGRPSRRDGHAAGGVHHQQRAARRRAVGGGAPAPPAARGRDPGEHQHRRPRLLLDHAHRRAPAGRRPARRRRGARPGRGRVRLLRAGRGRRARSASPSRQVPPVSHEDMGNRHITRVTCRGRCRSPVGCGGDAGGTPRRSAPPPPGSWGPAVPSPARAAPSRWSADAAAHHGPDVRRGGQHPAG